MVMKKVLSISLAFLLVLSLIHLTIAIHVCQGEIAEVKVSLTGETGTCGMEKGMGHNALPLGFSNHCCDDESSVFAVEVNYSPKNTQLINLTENLSITPFILLSGSFSFSNPVESLFTNVRPPGNNLVYAPSLPFICVFRI